MATKFIGIKIVLFLPEKNPWMQMLKVSRLEGNEISAYPRLYFVKRKGS